MLRKRGLAVLLVAAAIGVAALVVCLLAGTSRSIASNVDAAAATLRAYHYAQQEFRSEDRYGIGKAVFANPMDGTGMPDLWRIGGPGSGGTHVGLLTRSTAMASARYGEAKAGYVFYEVVKRRGEHLDYGKESVLCAIAEESGRHEPGALVIDETGEVLHLRSAMHVYREATRADPEGPSWPEDPAAEGWVRVGR